MKIPPVEAEVFHAVGHADKHDKANGFFSQFCENTLKNSQEKYIFESENGKYIYILFCLPFSFINTMEEFITCFYIAVLS